MTMQSAVVYEKMRCNTHEACAEVCAAFVDGERLVIIKRNHGREHALILTKAQIKVMFGINAEQ